MIPRTDRNWIQTFTGKQFWPLNPRVEEVDIKDIAHALSMKCRFTGHVREFYSVAQHSILASIYCTEAPLWALLHDATEAYMPDVARPVKRHLHAVRAMEDRLQEVIAEKFGLQLPMPECVKEIDLRLLATERRDLMASPPIPWVSTESVEPLDFIRAWSLPTLGEVAFLHRYAELTAGKTCWSCIDPIFAHNSLPVVGHPTLRVCERCDAATARASGRKIGDAIAKYSKSFDEPQQPTAAQQTE